METGQSLLADYRHIRSFVLREGRLTDGQQRALNTLWDQLGVPSSSGPLDLTRLFGRSAETVLEIGFGDGESLVAMAAADPMRNFLGVEVHRPGIGHALLCAEQAGVRNLRVLCADAVTVLEEQLCDAVLARVQVFFPDPWPKKRHHKRRLIQPGFLHLLARKVAIGGALHIATDHAEYAEAILAALQAVPTWVNTVPDGGFAPRPAYRPSTKFERRGQRLGHGVWDVCCVRAGVAASVELSE